MSAILVASTAALGAVKPLVPIVKALVERGHSVWWYTGQAYAADVKGTGAIWVPMSPGADRPDGELDAAFQERAALSGLRQLRWDMKHLFIDAGRWQAADMHAFLARQRVDVIVSDAGMVGAMFVAEAGGPLWATVGVTPLMLPSRDTAPFGTALTPSTNFTARLRNTVLNYAADHLLLRDVSKHLALSRQAMGLPSRPARVLQDAVSPLLHLQNGIAEFEYPRSDLPRQVHFVGALVDAADGELPPWWQWIVDSPVPIVHVTQGTLANLEPGELVLPTIAALADEPVRVVAQNQHLKKLGPLPDNARVAPFLPHDRLFPHISVLVTNGGFGAVQRALENGVPLVVAGATEDKSEVAARVAWSGAGINLRTATPTPADVRAAVRAVLGQRQYRDNAKRLGVGYLGSVAGITAASLIERLADSRSPVFRNTKGSR